MSKTKTYDELTIAEFSAGYASILKLPSLSETERSARLDYFIVLMYLVTQFNWSAVREFHAAVLFEIECGRARWGDSFADLETRLLRNSSRSTSSGAAGRSGSGRQFCFVGTTKTTNVRMGKIILEPFRMKRSGYSISVPNAGQFPAWSAGTRNFRPIVPRSPSSQVRPLINRH